MKKCAPGKILVVRNDRFGEFLLNIPAFRALKQGFPGSRLIAIVDPRVTELARAISYIDEVISWGAGRHSFLEKLALIRVLKGKRIQSAVMLNPSRQMNILTFLAGIPRRVGYNRKSACLLTDKIEDRKNLAQKHEVEYNLDLVRVLGVDTGDLTLSLEVDSAIINHLLSEYGISRSDNLIAIHPWTSDQRKEWPAGRFRELAARLAGETGVKVLIIGGKDEEHRNPGFVPSGGDKLVNLAGKTSLLALAALLGICKLLISGDSGPVHLAACVNTPVVALFRNDLPGKGPKRWGPWGKNNLVIEKDSLADITVEEVIKKAKEVLKR